MKTPRSPHDQVGGIVYFGRMVDKIRLMDTGELRSDLHANLGISFDERCTHLLGVNYGDLAEEVKRGATDEAALAWAFDKGKRPSEEQIEIWNAFMSKRGWNDEVVATLISRKKESGFEDRDDIQTMFDYLDADEDRALRPKITE